jgi:hypothetical protein
VTRLISPVLVGLLGVAPLTLLASCDTPGGDGSRWSCATSYNGTLSGAIGEDGETTGLITAQLRLVRGSDDDWVFIGQYEQREGTLNEAQSVQTFTSTVEEDGTLVPSEAGFELTGSVDLDGPCDVEGTWEFFGSGGSFSARP